MLPGSAPQFCPGVGGAPCSVGGTPVLSRGISSVLFGELPPVLSGEGTLLSCLGVYPSDWI